MNQTEIFIRIVEERRRQDLLHPNNKKEDYLSILAEEFGEVGKALQGEGDLKEELVHLAAVSVRWLETL